MSINPDSHRMTEREKRSIFREMVAFFGGTCVRCRGASGLANVERDHVVPSYQGGADEPWNYQPLCARCNASKGAETTDHRIAFCEDYDLTMPALWLP